MSSTYKIQTDIKEAKAMVESLEDYVRGDQLYGHAEGGFFSRFPSLTVGALVMRLRRLQAFQDNLSDAQQRQLDGILQMWQETREEWRLHYEEKVVREALSRIDSMKAFFRECTDSMLNCHNNYRPELLKRTIVQELLREMDALNIDNDEVDTFVKMADNKLHQFMRKDKFQWADQLKAVYPEDEFWWLYQKPPKKL